MDTPLVHTIRRAQSRNQSGTSPYIQATATTPQAPPVIPRRRSPIRRDSTDGCGLTILPFLSFPSRRDAIHAQCRVSGNVSSNNDLLRNYLSIIYETSKLEVRLL